MPASAPARPAGPASESSGTPPAESTGTAPSESSPAPQPPETGTHPNRTDRREGCHLSIDATSHRITAGESVTVFGALLCPSASVADQPVTVYQLQPAGGATRLLVGTATTEADGSYQLTPAALSTNSTFLVRSQGAPGAHTGVKVAPQVTLSGPPAGAPLSTGGGDARIRAQYGVTFSGTVSPAGVGARVVLQREDALAGEQWHPIAFGQVDEEGKYSITHTFGAPGDANIRVVVHPRGSVNAAAASELLSYDISPRQNPRLTIQGSTDPISQGQSVTITGVADRAADQPVTLLARTQGNAFIAVAKGTTDGSGNYRFTQSPLQSTFYRVTTATRRSIQLFEGVKYALSAERSPGAVQAGQQLTFSGTVAPDSVGHVVYLERQWASRLGFHVVDVGTVSVASTYSIAHTFYNAATDVMRIEVPGDSENQGQASEPFTIEVTPTPATALGSEAPASPISGED